MSCVFYIILFRLLCTTYQAFSYEYDPEPLPFFISKTKPDHYLFNSFKQDEKSLDGLINETITWKDDDSLNEVSDSIRRKKYKAKPSTLPFMVLITIKTNDNIYTCTGTILDPRRVLTAAHCFFRRNNQLDVKSAYLVPASLPGFTRNRGIAGVNLVQQIFIHANFNASTLENDIAIVSTLIPFTNDEASFVKIVDDFDGEDREEVRNNVFVASFTIREISRERRLEQVPYSLKFDKQCSKRFSSEIQDFIRSIKLKVLCAIQETFTDIDEGVCFGDSGSSLFFEKEIDGVIVMHQIGVGSFTQPNCGVEDSVSWFSDLRSYASAIKENRMEDCRQWRNVFQLAPVCDEEDEEEEDDISMDEEIKFEVGEDEYIL